MPPPSAEVSELLHVTNPRYEHWHDMRMEIQRPSADHSVYRSGSTPQGRKRTGETWQQSGVG